jgi:hypothetical protein
VLDQIGQEAQTAATTATGDVNTATAQGNQTLTAAQQQQLGLLQPYLAAGTGALNPLTSDIASETNPANQFSFSPTQYQQDPEYAFQLQQAQQALQRQQAAGGGLNTGGADKAASRLAVGFTNSTYGDAFNRALSAYQTNRQNTLNQIAGYQGLVGTGLNATGVANSDIGNDQGQIAKNTIAAGEYAGNTGLEAAKIQASALGAKGNAQAAGDIGIANSVNGALGGVTNAVNRYTLGGFGISGVPSTIPGPSDGGVLGPNFNPGVYSIPPPTVTSPTQTGNSVNLTNESVGQ